MEQTQVKTRSNTLEPVSFDKITARLSSICSWQLDFKSTPNMFSIDWCAPIKSVDPISISKKICARIYHGIPTSELDAMSAELCAAMAINNPDYGKLASRIVVSNNQKVTPDNLFGVIKLSEENTDANGNKSPLYHPDVAAFITKWADILDDMICYDRDYDIDFFGFKTLSRSYLLKSNGSIIERPQHLWMRVAVFLHAPYSQKIYIDAGDQESGDQDSGDQDSGGQESGDQNTHEFIRMMLQPYFDKIKETYDALSCKEFIHATPTLFHAGTPRPQCSSCFLMGTEDSVEGIYKTISDAAMISKWAGGIGLHISNIRANGSYIRKTAGRSLGIMPMLKVYNDTARYINQSGRRNGSFALYIEPWHADIFDFLDAKKNQGAEEARARDLFYALWIPDLFMQRVRDDLNWCLMCPDESPGLCDCYGEEFETLYKSYESSGKYRKELKAREIWKAIINSQIETGTPYMLYKDAANSCSNQQNIGMIKSSNLCVAPETMILTDKGQIEIQTLENQKINVWNGHEFSEVVIKQTNDCSKLITVELDDGSELTCTPYHKFYIQKSYNKDNVDIVEAQHLKKDMKLIKSEYPIIDQDQDLLYSYTNGIFSGDGTYYNNFDKEPIQCKFKPLKNQKYCDARKRSEQSDEHKHSEQCQGFSYAKKARVTLYGDKIKLLKHLEYKSHGDIKDNRLNVTLTENLKDKFFVPMNYSMRSKMEWLSGYSDADGCIARNGTNESLQIASIHKEFLQKIKLMLQTCGISCKIKLLHDTRTADLPDGKGGHKKYNCKKIYRILIASCELQKLVELGFSPKRLVINQRTPKRSATKFVKVKNIIDNERYDKTFCFTEPKRNAGIFNGVITSQCTEILEYSDSKEYAVCNLASVNLTQHVKPNNKGIDEISRWQNIVIITIDNCQWCRLLKALLNKYSIKYTEYKLTRDKENNIEWNGIGGNLMKQYDLKKVPQLFYNVDCHDCHDYHDLEQKGIINNLDQDLDTDEDENQDHSTDLDEIKHIGGYDAVWNRIKPIFDYKGLYKNTQIITRNLNKIIDLNYYPVEETRISNLRHRPIGIGVQGLADVFQLLRLPFGSHESRVLNAGIHETISYAALSESCNLAETTKPYETYEGSPLSRGLFQFDLWEKRGQKREIQSLGLWNWDELRERIKEHGVRNSLLLAPMPTASTSQILGNNECFEPYTANVYTRRVLAGEFTVINRHLVNDLQCLDIQDDDMSSELVQYRGSVQNIDRIPGYFKDIYKTSWELKQKILIDMARDRGFYICQSQSLNLFFERPDYETLSKAHIYSWKSGLKTGSYYIRSKPALASQQFTVAVKKDSSTSQSSSQEPCEMCSA